MKSRLTFIIGLVLVLGVLIAGAYLLVTNMGKQKHLEISCIGGSEKTGFMRDADVMRILDERYNLTVKWTPMGSYDQVMMTSDQIRQRGATCLWPSSASAQHIFEARHSGEFAGYRAETLLQSPEVIYAGPQGADALVRAGLVVQSGEAYTMPKMRELLLDHVLAGKTWQELQAGNLQGPINISSTDPVRSNSGFTLAQLELIMISGDGSRNPNITDARAALPQMRQIYDSQGLQATSSDNGFRQWLTQGGEYQSPLYAGYENQIIQQVVTGGGSSVLDEVKMIYPDPTIYSDHPLLALDVDSGRLIDALKDEEIQTLAWQRYGFRSSINTGWNDMAEFETLPLAEHIRTVPATNAEVTLALLACLQDRTQCS